MNYSSAHTFLNLTRSFKNFCFRELLQQWIDLARFTGLQVRKTEPSASDPPNPSAILCNETEEASIDEREK